MNDLNEGLLEMRECLEKTEMKSRAGGGGLLKFGFGKECAALGCRRGIWK